MSSRPSTQPRPRALLTQERILRAAIELADEAGIEALSMRRLGTKLGVKAMTLYYHVGKKDDLLASIVDIVINEIELPAADLQWKIALRRCAMSAHEVLVRHRWAANLVLQPRGPDPAHLRYMNAVLGTLRRAGFTVEQTHHAYHALDSHVLGFTLWEVGMNLGSEQDVRALAAAFLPEIPPELRYLAEHVEHHTKPRDPAEKEEFAFGLDLILDGLERMLDESSRQPRTER
ncbi:MAG TPA: TetR/AcrR family transcriptional regulator C-terminal domain-containing protein [Thermoanaerobaculia bacterium]|nr:TetR/AcrR family transcriptional regulator C-terminal domain-containing protein [Thermoanaerobaculia bacterium]